MNLTEDLLEDPQFAEFRGLPDGRCRKNATGEYIGKRQATLFMTRDGREPLEKVLLGDHYPSYFGRTSTTYIAA